MEKEEIPETLLEDIDCIVNLASCLNDHEAAIEAVNVAAAVKLFAKAQTKGVRHFIQMSSAKVHGEASYNTAFTEDSPCKPATPYAASKFKAEMCMKNLANADSNQTCLTIIRPPLVYGPGAKGNIEKLVKWLAKGLPMPFASVKNKRSFIYIENLCDALITCIKKPELSSRTFLVSDCHDISTCELIQFISIGTGNRPILMPFPEQLLKNALSLILGKGIADRLSGSFQVDSSLFCRLLDWKPPYDLPKSLAKTGRWQMERGLKNDR